MMSGLGRNLAQVSTSPPNARSYGEFVRSGLLARLGRSVLPTPSHSNRVRRTPTIFGARNSLNSFRFNARWSSGVKIFSFPSQLET
jgi:hypothetical protein